MNFLSTEQAAKKLGVAIGTLANWRVKGYGPIYIKVGWGIIYDPEEIDNFKKVHKSAPHRKRKRSR